MDNMELMHEQLISYAHGEQVTHYWHLAWDLSVSTNHKLCGCASLHQSGKLAMHIELPMQVQVTW